MAGMKRAVGIGRGHDDTEGPIPVRIFQAFRPRRTDLRPKKTAFFPELVGAAFGLLRVVGFEKFLGYHYIRVGAFALPECEGSGETRRRAIRMQS